LGIPVAAIHLGDYGFTVRFHDTLAYRAWKDFLPKKIFGQSVGAVSQHVTESGKIDEAARQEAIITKARAYLSREGYSVKSIKFNESYYESGMTEFDGGGWTGESLGVTFTDAQNLSRWNKRWFHRAGGLSVHADAAPAPGLGFPDPKDHFAAALKTAGADDAQFVAASANLDNKQQNWSYRFISPSRREFIDVITDFLGNAALQNRKPARDLMVHPIDMSKVVSLQTAFDAAKSETFKPAWVNLDRDFHGRVLYRFSDQEGKKQVRINATTGKIAD
jgi:hypothetical protein